jgi:L-ascorbate metabolism protein UlaG (beta-lactamase superfamily)
MILRRVLVAAACLVIAAGGFLVMDAWTATGKRATGARLATMKASPNWRDGKFVNSLPNVEPKIFKALRKWMSKPDHTVPDTPLPVVERGASDFDIGPESGLRITWLGHSTFLAEIDGHRLLIDPVWSERPSPFSWMGPRRFHEPPLPLDQLPAIDAVVISHDHFDHLDYRTVKALGGRVPLYIAPLGVGAHLEYWGVPAERVIERDWWGEVTVGDLTLTATPARHFSGRSPLMTDRDATLWCGWVIAGRAHRIYYSGDSGMFPGFATIGERLGPFDAVLMEIGAYNQMWRDVHMGPEQAIDARVAVGSGLFIPVHWGTFDLALHAWTEPVERLLVAAEKAGVQVAIPQPGQSIEPSNPPQVVHWWPEIPWQSAEEAPVISSGLRQVARAGSERVGERVAH